MARNARMTAPDLAEVQTPAAFMAALRDYRELRALRIKTGFRQMAARCKHAYTATPLRDALIADDLPHLAMLRAILSASARSTPSP